MIPDELSKRRAVTSQAESCDPQDIIRIVDSHGGGRSTLMSVLGDIQAKYRYLPQDALRTVAEKIGIPLVDVYAAATFYHAFSLKPKGKHIVLCCQGTACHVRGGAGIAEELERQLGIEPGETTEDMQFTFETVNCLGACALGPVVVIDGRYFSKVRKSQIRQILDSVANGLDDIDDIEAAYDARVFPLQVNCPHCGRSLMDPDNPLHGSPSIGLTAAAESKRGWVRLSGVYGVNAVKRQHVIPEGMQVDYFCPRCHKSLVNAERCPECEAPMARMDIAGGSYAICSRSGCSGHMLDLRPSNTARAGSRLARTHREVSSKRG